MLKSPYAGKGPWPDEPTEFGYDVAAGNIRVLITLADLPKSSPGADVVPADIRSHDRRAIRLFHQGVID